jgi:tetratricopeptide (TPR) repeat protein
MKINTRYGRLYDNITSHKYYLLSLISILFLIIIYYFLTWPIVGYDTDLWYHLSGGRYFWQNGTIARDAFFSYVTPPKSWYNYYWLFQAIIYKIFQWSGYYGLIALRCLLYLFTVVFICLFFIRQRENRTELLAGIFLFICCTTLILFRELLVRPHLFSYLFIIVFLYILEYKRDKIWLLPVFGVLWSNIHGIEYPVMFLIVFAYLGEQYYHQIRKTKQYPLGDKKTKWLLIAVFYTVFITPQISELIQSPFEVSFQNAAYQHLYVAELLSIPLTNFFVFAPVTVNGFISSLQNIIVLFTVACFLISIWKKQLRISHGLLFICSLLLLAKHTRFTYEFTLLSIPLMCHGLHLVTKNARLSHKLVDLVFPVVIIIMPLIIFSNVFSNRPAYPLSLSNLPTGVVSFLNNSVSGGKILNEPNTGGYLPWALNSQFKIYMDMQMTIFSDLDFATANNAFRDANVFKAFIQKYNPSFISVSLNRPYFKKVVEKNGNQFVPVFFDNTEALYVNNSHYKDLAKSYELKTIDPFTYKDIKYKDQSEEQLKQILAEAARIYETDPINYGANHIICSIYIIRRQYEKAFSYAENIIQHYPDLSHGYALKADALFGMERYAEAARLYKKALDMGQTAQAENVYRNLYAAYVKLKEYKKAYKLLFQYVNPFALNADYKDIYQLGMSAATIGKLREAVAFLKIARMKTPPEDKEYIDKVNESLLMFGSDAGDKMKSYPITK